MRYRDKKYPVCRDAHALLQDTEITFVEQFSCPYWLTNVSDKFTFPSHINTNYKSSHINTSCQRQYRIKYRSNTICLPFIHMHNKSTSLSKRKKEKHKQKDCCEVLPAATPVNSWGKKGTSPAPTQKPRYDHIWRRPSQQI